MFKWIKSKLAKDSTEIPLFWVDFNEKITDKKNCMAHIHLELRDDKVVIESLNKLIDYIRDNYDMNKM